MARVLSNKSPRHAITACSGVISFLWIRRPFHLSLGIKQVSRLINLTDRPHCAECQPKRKPYCLLSWRLTFYCSLIRRSWKERTYASLVIDLKKTASSRRAIECLKQKLWSLNGAHNLSSGMHWSVVHPWHMETVAGFVCLVSYILNLNLFQDTFSLLLACCLRLHPMMEWNGIYPSVWVCVHVTVCLWERGRRKREDPSRSVISV